jgi:putative transposase
MIRTYKRKLILTKAQESRLKSWIGACRTVYNLGLQVRIETYKKIQKSTHKYELMKQITDLRKDVSWINDVNADCLQKSIESLDKAYNSFFKGGGFPKFASKKTFNYIQFKHIKVINNSSIKLPKFGIINIFNDESILGYPKTATIKLEPKGFFITIQCENVPQRFASENQTIGIDMGIAKFCIDSNGKTIENPRHFAKYERKLRIENRSLSRKRKGSNGWKKQAKRLSLLHHKIGNVRLDFLHKESTKIAKVNNVVYVENLNVAGMSKNTNLSKHILDAGWAMFRQMLSYKTNVIAINPAYTSQTCFECKHVAKENRVSQYEFVCANCGHADNADVNAAKNIKRIGSSLDRQREAVA